MSYARHVIFWPRRRRRPPAQQPSRVPLPGLWSRGVEFGDDALTFVDYVHPAASVCAEPVLSVSGIRDVDPAGFPPEIRTTAGETLFVSKLREGDLRQFAERHRIPQIARPDIWMRLLEPFLDTTIGHGRQADTDGWLRDRGLSEAEIARARARVGPMMTAYNELLWEWEDLNLSDLVLASASSPDAGLYWWAMGIADRAAVE